VERDFRQLQTGLLEVPPIGVRKESRTLGHVFCCMLALKISREMERRLQARFGTTDSDPHTTTLPDALPLPPHDLPQRKREDPSDVYWVEGIGPPNASTVGRNTLLTGGTNNFDLTLFKSFPIGERKRLEFRWEAQNAFNHPQFTATPGRSVNTSPAGRFLNRDFTSGGIRTMWEQVKLLF